MRQRLVRAYIYTQNKKYLIPDLDWLWVGLLTIPPWFVLIIADLIIGLRLFGFLPVWVITLPVSFIGSIWFFYYIHVGRPGKWFAHKVKSIAEPSVHRGVLPADLNGKRRRWLRAAPGEKLPTHPEPAAQETPRIPAFDAINA